MALQRRVSFNENPRVFKQTSLISAIFRSLSGHFRRSAVVVATQFCWRIDSWKHWIPAAFALVHGIQLIISLGRNLADPLPQERRAPSTIIPRQSKKLQQEEGIYQGFAGTVRRHALPFDFALRTLTPGELRIRSPTRAVPEIDQHKNGGALKILNPPGRPLPLQVASG